MLLLAVVLFFWISDHLSFRVCRLWLLLALKTEANPTSSTALSSKQSVVVVALVLLVVVGGESSFQTLKDRSAYLMERTSALIES